MAEKRAESTTPASWSNLTSLNFAGSNIIRIYNTLEAIRTQFFALDRDFGLKIPLRDVEQRWGEYFVANGLLAARISVERVQKRGVDIVTDCGTVEVKTSRRTRRFRGGRTGYGWAVKREQWQDRQFDFLVCVLADQTPPKTLAFVHDEVVKNFTKANFTRDNTGVREFDAKRLDLIDGGLEGFKANLRRSRKVLSWEGTPTAFELAFNTNPKLAFERYTLKRMYQLMKERRKSA